MCQGPGAPDAYCSASKFCALALRLVHASPVAGHLGQAKTLRRAKANFYWKRLEQDVKEFVSTCMLCQKFKGHHIQVLPARQWPIAEGKFFLEYI